MNKTACVWPAAATGPSCRLHIWTHSDSSQGTGSHQILESKNMQTPALESRARRADLQGLMQAVRGKLGHGRPSSAVPQPEGT